MRTMRVLAGIVASGLVVGPAVSAAATSPAYLVGSQLWTVTAGGYRGTPAVPLSQGGCTAIAVTPSGADGYVACPSADAVDVVDLPDDQILTAIPVADGPSTVAMAPDGHTAYVATDAGVVPIDVGTNTTGPLIPFALNPSNLFDVPESGIAITPDGSTLLIADPGAHALLPIDLATRTVQPAVMLGGAAVSVAVTPDGRAAYVVTSSGASENIPESGALTPVALPSLTPRTPIPLAAEDPDALQYPHGVAISPNGTTAYVGSQNGFITVDLGSGESTREMPTWTQTLAVSPDGTEVFGSNPENICGYDQCTGGIDEFDPETGATTTIGTEVGQALPWGVAVPPDPHAAFTATPAVSGTPTMFDASASTNADGLVTTYSWTFGYGATETTLFPTDEHVYDRPGTYSVTLTTTNQGGCATRFVFTGQTDTCTGMPTASATETVRVVSPPPYGIKSGVPHAPTFVFAGRLRIRGRHLTVRLACTANHRCQGTVALVRRHRRVGVRRFSLAARSTRTLRLTLSPGVARAVRRRHRVTLAITQDGSARVTTVTTRRVMIVNPALASVSVEQRR